VRCAVKVQRQVPIVDGDQPAGRAIRFRVGINIGDAIADGTDLHGDAVNIAARLQTECPTGGICVSRSVRDHVHGRLDLAFEALGALELKNIERPVQAYVVKWDPGDWKTAALVRAMKVMSTGLKGGTSFMEDYTYHLVPGREKILGAHMLEVCPSITTRRPSLEIHPLSIGGREDPVRLRFTADPGPGIVAGLSDLGDRFRLTVNEIDVVEPDEPLPRLPVACAVWRPRPSLATSAEAWLIAGAPHHTVLSKAVGVDVLADFAEMCGVEMVVIDADTTVRAFRRELRWNAAYHRLAERL